MVIVAIMVLYQLIFELVQGVKLFQVKEFTLQMPEEVFHHGVVKAVALSAHALIVEVSPMFDASTNQNQYIYNTVLTFPPECGIIREQIYL